MTTRTLQRSFFSLLIVLLAGACSGGGGCGGCGAMDPLPQGGLPGDQTIEGGAQIRISDQGFETITSIIPAVLQDSLGGTCIPGDGVSALGGLVSASYCSGTQGTCVGGCELLINIDSVVIDVPQDDQLRIANQNRSACGYCSVDHVFS